MDHREISPDFTEDGRLRLLAAELDILGELVAAGDRGAFHFLYGEMADNSDSRLTAKISTFSDTVGGTAMAANWALQVVEPGYAGIYRISQQIAADIYDLVLADAQDPDGGTGYLTVTEHFESAEATWDRFGLSELFPGNLINLIRNESDLGFLGEAADFIAFLTGGASAGERAGLWGALYSMYTGKRLSDFVGEPGYTILEVAGGHIVIDSDGRTTATFISAGQDDILAAAANGFTLGAAWETFLDNPETLYALMGNVGSPTTILPSGSEVYADARRDFSQYSGGYTGDNDPASYPSVGSPTITITQTATGDRDLLMYGAGNDTVQAGGGNDMVLTATGNDDVFGEDGDDILWGQEGSDMLDGGAGNDILRGGIDNDALYGGAGDDIIDGADITVEGFERPLRDYLFGDERLAAIDGHDILMGGTGNDLIRGGLGADLIFDRGLDQYAGDEIDISTDNTALYAYDGGDGGNGVVLGSDTVLGGAGADILVYSGGRDTFYGGTGDDTYLISPEFLEDRQFGHDALTIVLEEDPNDETTWFGHDYVIGNGFGIHEIVFEGLNRDDVTFSYEYEEVLLDEMSVELQTIFLSLLGIDTLDLGSFPVYGLMGRLAITVNSTGSSIYFSNVSGAYVGGANNPGGNIYIEPVLYTQTYAVFEDGIYYDWARQLELNNFINPINTPLPEEADDALGAWGAERGTTVPEEDPEEIFGTNLTDVLVGTSADDFLNAGAGNDYLAGEDGDDRLRGGTGSDYINGGAGFDEADYSLATSAIRVSLATGRGTLGDASGDLLVSIEAVRGSDFADTINGVSTQTGNILRGMGGNDRIETGFGAGLALVYGGDGDDVLIVRGGNARMEGDAGNDQLFSGPGAGIDILFGGSGDDTIVASMGNDTYDGGSGYDILSTQNLLSTLAARYVHLADGIMRARFFEDTSIGIGTNQIAGFEAYLGGQGDDQVFGTDGANLIGGGRSNDDLYGGGGDDTLYGGWNNDTLRGGDGNDSLYGDIDPSLTTFSGQDRLFGGAGIDTAHYHDASSNYSFSTQGQVLFITNADGISDQISDDVEFIAFLDATFTWAELAASLQNIEPIAVVDAVTVTEGETVELDVRANDSDANGDALTVVALNGRSFGPNSTLFTGPGLDLSIRMTANGALSFTAADPFGSDLLPGQIATVTLTYTVSDGLGGFDDATITVTVVGAPAGPDGIVTGSAGNDTMNGAFVDTDGDRINGSGQTIDARDGNDRVFDGAGNDIVLGGNGNDQFHAGAGDDTFFGGAGSDRVYAGAGADHFDGGGGTSDWAFFTRSSTGLTVDMTDVTNSTGIAAGDTFAGVERLTGSAHGDRLVASATVTHLYGGAGDDVIVDAAGRQSLWGNAGADTFRLLAGDGQRDEIFDFDVAADVLDLSAWGATAIADLAVTAHSNGSLSLALGSDSLLLRGLTLADAALLNAGNFVFAPAPPGGATVTGTEGADVLEAGYTGDPEGDRINNSGQVIEALAGNDVIRDGRGADTIFGGAGDDRVYSGGGGDSLFGGAGSGDWVFYSSAPTGLVIDMTDPGASTGVAAGTTFDGFERISGSAQGDRIVLSAHVQQARGGAGDDTLVDADGRQVLWGEAGADVFRFVAGDGQRDEIRDFDLSADVLDLSDWGTTGLGDLRFIGHASGYLIIQDGAESILMRNLTLSDVTSLGSDRFIFA